MRRMPDELRPQEVRDIQYRGGYELFGGVNERVDCLVEEEVREWQIGTG